MSIFICILTTNFLSKLGKRLNWYPCVLDYGRCLLAHLSRRLLSSHSTGNCGLLVCVWKGGGRDRGQKLNDKKLERGPSLKEPAEGRGGGKGN